MLVTGREVPHIWGFCLCPHLCDAVRLKQRMSGALPVCSAGWGAGGGGGGPGMCVHGRGGGVGIIGQASWWVPIELMASSFVAEEPWQVAGGSGAPRI